MRASVTTSFLGRIPKCIAAFAALACFTSGLHAQISVGVGGAGPIDFTTPPPATEWSTRDTSGGDANTYTSPATTDAGARTNNAALITNALLPDGNYGTGREARYNNTAGLESVYTQPTGVPAAILMATLRNDSGDNILSFTVSYDYNSDPSIPLPSAGEQAQAPGFRVLWSLSGQPQTWNVISNLSGVTNAGNVSATLQVDGWASGANLYLLWYDDNSNTNPDGTNTIDNFAISGVVNGAVPCPGITVNPTSISRQECFDSAATFSITATGAVAGVQWYRQEPGGGGFNPIAGANGNSYTLSSYTVAADNGAQFQAVVTNSVGCAATSTAATLTVVQDVTPPFPRYAVRYLTPTNITVTNLTIVFNEPISATTTNNPDWYAALILTDTNTATQIEVFSDVNWPNSTTAILHTADLDPTHGYTLTMELVNDACRELQMPLTTIPVNSFASTPLPLTATWKYLDNDIDPGAGWFAPGFVDSGWSSGTGPFDNKRNGNYPTAPSNCRSNTLYMMQGPVPTCFNLTSPVTGTNLITAYFRAHFNYTGQTNQTLLQLSGKFDDGAIVYLNGREVWRTGVANSGVTHTTLANRTVGDGDGRDILLLVNSTNLLTGDNVLAVEVHQINLTSSDTTMGLEAHAFTQEQLAGPPVQPELSISNNGGVFTVTWDPAVGTLQRSTDISSPANWVTIPGASSPFVTNAPPSIQFFRVTVP